MYHQTIRSFFFSALSSVESQISSYVYHPAKDFTRTRKLSASTVMNFLVSQGSSSTKNELLDFFAMDTNHPTASALNQQRAKLKPEALEAVFQEFQKKISSLTIPTKYRFLAADGSTFTFFGKPSPTSSEYYVSEGHSAKGFYNIHLNALYDLTQHTYTDAFLQPVHEKDEFRAFCHMVDRHITSPNTKEVFIADRGYCSYNAMAHVIEKGQYFLFRTKDIHSKGLVQHFEFPNEASFDITVSVTLVRTKSTKKLPVISGYQRFLDAKTSFDFIEYGTANTYSLSFRIVRFPISEDTYECIVTNLPAEEFPLERIKALYFSRWGIEGSFRKLKYTIGLSNFHSYKPEYIKQEIWARLLAYNITETLINATIVKQGETKHEYKVNFSVAAHSCRVFLRPTTEKDPIDVITLLQRELIPIRNKRQYPRLKTAHFRRPRYFIYRAS